MLDRLVLKDAALADQLRRAASSVRVGKDRAHHYRIAGYRVVVESQAR